jgi:site-specific recombinase XerD
MATARYFFRARPATTAHGYPYLVFDSQQRLHRALTDFARDVAAGRTVGTVQGYLHALLPWFTWLETAGPGNTGIDWRSPPEQIRQAVAHYLGQRLHCQVQAHPHGWHRVARTRSSRSGVNSFLVALQLFYRWACRVGAYPFAHPLVDPLRELAAVARQEAASLPAMPAASGVELLLPRRLSDRYFRLVQDAWLPQTLDDPTFYARILAGGQGLAGWGLGETCVTRLLFDTGARISEICGLTVGDWAARGLLQEASAFSKGSHQRRVKFVRFSAATAKLLRRYCDTDRPQRDPTGATLDDYLQRARSHQLDLYRVPLFLSRQRTPLSPAGYRRCAWQPACAAAGLRAHPHQARHWYVTMAVRQIHETAGSPGEITRRQQELVAYMHWQGGSATLAAYNHYFDIIRHAEVQDQLHARMEAALQAHLAAPPQVPDPPPAPAGAPLTVPPDDLAADFAFLVRLGGQGHGC